MILFFVRTLLYFAAAAIGLLVASWLLPGFEIEWAKWWGFFICAIIFAILQSILTPWITKLADRYAPMLLGGIGIISTLVSLVVVVLLPIGGIRITDALGWILGSVIVWLVTAIGTVVLPMIFIKRKVNSVRSNKA